jgi:hypothetical protein
MMAETKAESERRLGSILVSNYFVAIYTNSKGCYYYHFGRWATTATPLSKQEMR